MKVSDLIKNIVAAAENKFGMFNENGFRTHCNNCATVYIYYNNADNKNEWQVGLERPSHRQLESGEIEDWNTVRICENNVAFYTIGETLLDALCKLQDKVNEAGAWDFDLFNYIDSPCLD